MNEKDPDWLKGSLQAGRNSLLTTFLFIAVTTWPFSGNLEYFVAYVNVKNIYY